MKNEKPIECTGCNTFDVGSILDNSEVTAQVERVYGSEAKAQEALARLNAKAKEVDEGYQVESQIDAVEGGFKLDANFTFSCQAEVVIFQLGTRAI